MDNQTPRLKALALNCLIWIIYAQRPLDTRELQVAVALTSNRACQQPTDIEVDKVEVILEACGNLLLEENNAIRPVHYSVQEFLLKSPDKISSQSFRGQLTDLDSVHSTLADVCIRYMQLGTFSHPCQHVYELDDSLLDAPFALYAAHHFDYHLSRCEDISESTLHLVDNLLQQSSAFLAAILQIRYLQDDFKFETILRDFRSITSAVSASDIIYGTRLLEIRHLEGHLADHKPPRYALHQASSVGSLNTIEKLIELGCQVNAQDDSGANPIYYASARGHERVVEILLRKEANLNAQGGHYGNALQAASHGGHDRTVELLLGRGADVNAQGGGYGNALQAASHEGHDRTVELLLGRGAEINHQHT